MSSEHVIMMTTHYYKNDLVVWHDLTCLILKHSFENLIIMIDLNHQFMVFHAFIHENALHCMLYVVDMIYLI